MGLRQHMFLAGLTTLADATLVCAGTGRLSVAVWEEGRADAPLPCRAWVEAGTDHCFQPDEKTCTPYYRDRSLSCDGRFTIEMPPGPAILHVERGKEYHPVDQQVEIKENAVQTVEVRLRRWVDMRKAGWLSADLHVHFGFDKLPVLKQSALADDVNLVPALSYWNQFHTRWPDWPEGPCVPVGDNRLVTRGNMEIERIGGSSFGSTGALLIYGLSKPVFVQRQDRTWPPDAVFGRMAKQISPDCVIDADKPLWGENVVGMALGLFDCVQICHNHYHRAGSMGPCCGMIGQEIEEEPRNLGAAELFWRTNEIYYRWLNCGFRLAVTGGSAIGVMPVPLGYSRTYAKLDGPLTEANYLKAIRAGRTFATSGPMLVLAVNGQQCGSVIECRSGKDKSLEIRANLQSIQSIDSLELVHNGQVVRKIDCSAKKAKPVLAEVLEYQLTPKRSGWIAARAIYQSPNGHLRQAHTSPVYIRVDDKPTASRRDAEFMMRWIDQLLKVSDRQDRYTSDADRREVQEIYREARAVYQRIAATATATWGD